MLHYLFGRRHNGTVDILHYGKEVLRISTLIRVFMFGNRTLLSRPLGVNFNRPTIAAKPSNICIRSAMHLRESTTRGIDYSTIDATQVIVGEIVRIISQFLSLQT